MQIGEIDCERSTSSLIVLSGISFHLLTWCFRLMTSGASSHWHTGLLMVSISGSEEGQSCMVLMGMACQLPPHTELPSGPLLRRHALAIVYCLYSTVNYMLGFRSKEMLISLLRSSSNVWDKGLAYALCQCCHFLKGVISCLLDFSLCFRLWRMNSCFTSAKIEKSRTPLNKSECLFVPKLYIRNSVTSDCAVGGADVQKSRLLATRNVYNFYGVWITNAQRVRPATEWACWPITADWAAREGISNVQACNLF